MSKASAYEVIKTWTFEYKGGAKNKRIKYTENFEDYFTKSFNTIKYSFPK